MAGAWSGDRAMRWVLGVAVLLLGIVAVPGPVAAAEPQTLPGSTLTATVVDLDGDGSREVVRIVDAPGPGLIVEAWGLDADAWTAIGSTELHSLIPNSQVDAGEPGEIAALLLWRRDGTERVLALTAAFDLVGGGANGTCCMTIGELRRTPSSVRLQPMWSGRQAPESVRAVDLDGDGTDELVTESVSVDEENHSAAIDLEVLRWNGGRFVSVGTMSRSNALPGLAVGDTDGIPGAEIVWGPSEDGWLQRLSWVDGSLSVDETWLSSTGPEGGFPSAVVDGEILMLRQGGIDLLEWPRRGEARRSARKELEIDYPGAFPLGTGADTLLVVQDNQTLFIEGGDRAATVYDRQLDPLGTVRIAPATEPLWRLWRSMSTGPVAVDTSIFPYVGPLPIGSIDGRDAYFASGTLMQPDGHGGIETRPVAPLIGTQPLGSAGPDDAWIALLRDAVTSGGTFAYLYPIGTGSAPGRLALVPVATLLAPEPLADEVRVELRDAVEVAATDEAATLLAGPDGFEAVIAAPPGAVVVEINDSAATSTDVGAAPVSIEVRPPSNRDADENLEFSRSVVVMLPDGRARVMSWQGTILREPPSLEATASTAPFSLTATVRGEVGPGTSVTVDGRPVAVHADGSFETDADAPIWPRDIVVSARDPFGHEQVQRLEVVGFLDYRGLPWVPILGLGTVVAGLVLFLRTPRRREAPTMTWTDATLEEIDGD